MLSKVLVMLFLTTTVLSCKSGDLKYVKDFEFVPSGKSLAPEALVKLNDYPCMDVTGKPGSCFINLKKGDDLTIQILPRPYFYKLSIICSKGLGTEEANVLVHTGIKYTHVIHTKAFTKSSFSCKGELFPQEDTDNAPTASSVFEFKARLHLEGYKPRAGITIHSDGNKTYATIGKYALHTFVYVPNSREWEYFYKRPVIEIPSRKVIIYSESFNSRHSYYQGVK